MGRYNDFSWPRYVSVAERKEKALKHQKALQKKGHTLNPVVIVGRTIAKTFWGKAWCDNLEAYSDYSNRLPRGRTYARNGSIIDLQISKGSIEAQVMGSSLYRVTIGIKPILEAKWKGLLKDCAGKIDSLIELLQGKFSKGIMEILTKKREGLFPAPQEISMKCSCPDSAGMCKHIAAVLYGVGASLDNKPENLFVLRHVDHVDLIASAGSVDILTQSQTVEHVLEDASLSALFGIEIEDIKAEPTKKVSKTSKTTKAKKTPTKKKSTTSKAKPSKQVDQPKTKLRRITTAKKKNIL